MAGSNSNRVRLTRAFVLRVVHGKEHPGPWHDTESPLRLRGTQGGASYSVRRKIQGRAVTFTPKAADGSAIENSANSVTLERARKWAHGVIGNLAQGLPVQPEKDPTPIQSFDHLAGEYLTAYRKAHTPQATATEEQGIRYASRVLGRLKLSEIDAAAAQRLKQAYAESPSSGRKAWGSAKRLLDLAVAHELVASNVLAGLPSPKAPRSRDRYPRLPDLPAIWRACEQTKGVGAAIIQFGIAMPLRPGAIARLLWSEVGLDAAELNLLEGDGRKFKGSQRLPLPSLALDLIRARAEAVGADGLVFGSDNPKNPGGVFSGWSKAVARIQERSGVADWSPHDFRRSAVSLVAEHRPDISEVSLDRWLTHAASSTNAGVKAVYQRAAGFQGMRLAADAWDEILRGVLADNVVPIRRAR